MDVLFVEDHADTRDAVEYLLRNRGATVGAATSVDEALSLYREGPPRSSSPISVSDSIAASI